MKWVRKTTRLLEGMDNSGRCGLSRSIVPRIVLHASVRPVYETLTVNRVRVETGRRLGAGRPGPRRGRYLVSELPITPFGSVPVNGGRLVVACCLVS